MRTGRGRGARRTRAAARSRSPTPVRAMVSATCAESPAATPYDSQ
jgi:hypothetical protein